MVSDELLNKLERLFSYFTRKEVRLTKKGFVWFIQQIRSGGKQGRRKLQLV